MKIGLLCSIFYGSLSMGMVFDNPKVTTLSPAANEAPATTAGPSPADFELRRRQTAGQYLLAPDNVCGYNSGNSSQPLSCGLTDRCELGPGIIVCCDTAFCGKAAKTCIDSTNAFVTSGTSASCGSRTDCITCDSSRYPYCNSYTFPGLGVYGFGCGGVKNLNFITVSTGFPGTFRIYDTISTLLSDQLASITSISSIKTSTSSTSSTTSTTSSSSSTTSSSSSSSTSVGPPTPPPVIDSGPPVGAIAGGTIGGVAVLAIIGGFICYFMRKKRKERQAQQQMSAVNPPPPVNYYNNAQFPPPNAGWGGTGAGAVAHDQGGMQYQNVGQAAHSPPMMTPLPPYVGNMQPNDPKGDMQYNQPPNTTYNTSPQHEYAPQSSMGGSMTSSQWSPNPNDRPQSEPSMDRMSPHHSTIHEVAN